MFRKNYANGIRSISKLKMIMPIVIFLCVILDKVFIFPIFVGIYSIIDFLLIKSKYKDFSLRNYTLSLTKSFYIALVIIYFYSSFFFQNYNFFDVDSGAYFYYAYNLSEIFNYRYVYLITSVFYRLFMGFPEISIPFGDGDYYLYLKKADIFFLNLSFVLTSIYLFLFSLKKFSNIFVNPYILVLFVVFPFTYKYTSFVGKESLIILFLSLSFYLFHMTLDRIRQEQFLLFILSLILFGLILFLGTLIRPYFISYLLAIFFIFFKYKKIIFFVSIFISLLFFLKFNYFSFEYIKLFINSLIILFLSPNPFSLINWISFPFETFINILFLICLLLIYLYQPKLFFIYIYAYLLINIPISLIVHEFNILNNSNYIAFYASRMRFPLYYFFFVQLFHIFYLINKKNVNLSSNFSH